MRIAPSSTGRRAFGGARRADYLYSSGSCIFARLATSSPAIESLRDAVSAHLPYYDDVVHDSAVQENLAGGRCADGLDGSLQTRVGHDAYLASINAELRGVRRRPTRPPRWTGQDRLDRGQRRDEARRERMALAASGEDSVGRRLLLCSHDLPALCGRRGQLRSGFSIREPRRRARSIVRRAGGCRCERSLSHVTRRAAASMEPSTSASTETGCGWSTHVTDAEREFTVRRTLASSGNGSRRKG